MLVLNRNILTIGGNRLEGGPLNPPYPYPEGAIKPTSITTDTVYFNDLPTLDVTSYYTVSNVQDGLSFNIYFISNHNNTWMAALTSPYKFKLSTIYQPEFEDEVIVQIYLKLTNAPSNIYIIKDT